MKKLSFVKMHGLGNDFVMVDGIRERISSRSWTERSIELCDRFRGVGADGVILALPSRRADFRMRIFNSDGSEAEMCGNGLRCMVRLLSDRGYLSKRVCSIETAGGMIEASIVSRRKTNFQVRYSVGVPDFTAANVPVRTKQDYFINGRIKIGRRNLTVTCLSIGNPNAVVFVDDFSFDWQGIGSEMERHRMFPRRTNVSFAKVSTRGRVMLKNWERGAGPTHASGTGACATVAAGVMVGLLNRRVEVVCDFGSLMVEWDAASNAMRQTGPADYCFTGVI
jgi:diaminopimelate epimerase